MRSKVGEAVSWLLCDLSPLDTAPLDTAPLDTAPLDTALLVPQTPRGRQLKSDFWGPSHSKVSKWYQRNTWEGAWTRSGEPLLAGTSSGVFFPVGAYTVTSVRGGPLKSGKASQ